MRKKPLARDLFIGYFVVMLMSILVVSHTLGVIFKNVYLSNIRNDLVARTSLVLLALEEDNFAPKGHGGIEGYVKDLGRTSATRITWIDRTGVVRADSDADPAVMENHRDRPEIKSALSGKTRFSLRYSRTLGEGMQYYATPVQHDGRIIGALRVALPVKRLEYGPTSTKREFLLSVLVVAIIAGIVSFLTTRDVAGSLERMRKSAQLFSNGNFKTRSPVSDTIEIGNLAKTLNHMMDDLERQFITISQQANEQSAILESMNEGVMAIDNDDNVLIMNRAATIILDSDPDVSKGVTLQEAVRNPTIQRFVDRVRVQSESLSEEFLVRGQDTRTVQATGTILRGNDHSQLGVLLVLNDITEFRKLENVRRDFVANVSHELRTPITSIKGYSEALLSGDLGEDNKTRDFLEVIERQADRLGAIIEDLLSLSAIEQGNESTYINSTTRKVCDIVSSAAANCVEKAEANHTIVEVDCDSDIAVTVNPRLMEQAILNLLDNAIKYTPNGTVTIKTEHLENEVAIRVIDTGCGIDEEHLPRVFERFYRVDKARSRKLGGTGLGLSIVKHIVSAHKGRVEVQSTPGVGSTFTIFIPDIVANEMESEIDNA
jgi:two-component system phosphate regulon sensor histidine kinase PhoR